MTFKTRWAVYKGVFREDNKWIAKISVNNVKIRLGRFTTLEAAHAAYCAAAKQHFGEFARTS